MKPLSESTVCVCDHGLFAHVARRLSRDCKKVYYWTPWEKSFPTVREGCNGDGFPDIERVNDIWSIKSEVDFFCFPDIGFSGLQKELRSQGLPVWGSGDADSIEVWRGKFLKVLGEAGLQVPSHKAIVGMDELRDFLKDKTDKWIKISKWRGDWETLHWRSWDEDSARLDYFATKFGPIKSQITFYVFDPINTEIEDGSDFWFCGGKFPERGIHGMEAKDKAYLGTFCDFKDLPDPVRKTNEDISNALRKFDYNGFFSTEIRIKTPDDFYFTDPTCFSDDTEILTDKGWRLFQKLDRTEKVATLNPKTGEIEYHKPYAYISHYYNGEMVNISNKEKTIECLVTPNHSVWRTDRNGKSLFEQRADRLTGKGFIPRTGNWSGLAPSFYWIPKYSKKWISGNRYCIERTHVRESIPVKMSSWVKFLGIYLSEGSCSKWSVCISQKKFIKEIEDILSELPFKWTRTRHGFQISNASLLHHMRSFGFGKCDTKFVPDFVKCLSPELISEFLYGHLLGDGSVHKGQNLHYTTSKQMADDIQELIFKSGSCANIIRREAKGTSFTINGKTFTRNHDIYVIRELAKHNKFWFEAGSRKQMYISSLVYSGMVHDVTVKNHIVYVRRNGKPFWSGNCRAGSPPSQAMTEMLANFSEIIQAGAHGICLEPVEAGKFGAQLLVKIKRNPSEWGTAKISEELDQWFKPSPCMMVDGVICWPPDEENVAGWLVAIGNTIEETLDTLKERIESLPDGLECDISPMSILIQEVEKAESEGMEFTDQEVPEPESVLE